MIRPNVSTNILIKILYAFLIQIFFCVANIRYDIKWIQKFVRSQKTRKELIFSSLVKAFNISIAYLTSWILIVSEGKWYTPDIEILSQLLLRKIYAGSFVRLKQFYKISDIHFTFEMAGCLIYAVDH